MVALIAFYFGWTMGARSGDQGVEEIKTALVSLRESDEFNGLISAVRKHAASMMHEVAGRLESADGTPIGMPDVLARVYDLIRPAQGGSRTT